MLRAQGIQQHVARALALHQQREAGIPLAPEQRLAQAQVAEAGEQQQRPPARGPGQLQHPPGGRRRVGLQRGVGQVGRQIQQRLLVVLERRGEHRLAGGVRQPQALAQISEARARRIAGAAPGGQRGRGEDQRPGVGVERRRQHRGHVDGRGAQADVARRGADPADGVALVAIHHARQLSPQRPRAPPQPAEQGCLGRRGRGQRRAGAQHQRFGLGHAPEQHLGLLQHGVELVVAGHGRVLSGARRPQIVGHRHPHLVQPRRRRRQPIPQRRGQRVRGRLQPPPQRGHPPLQRRRRRRPPEIPGQREQPLPTTRAARTARWPPPRSGGPRRRSPPRKAAAPAPRASGCAAPGRQRTGGGSPPPPGRPAPAVACR